VIESTIFLLTNAGFKDPQKTRDFLLDVAPRMQRRDQWEIPTIPGFCIERGLITGTHEKREHSGFGWSLKGHPDVRFSVSIRNNVGTIDPGVLDREDAINKEWGAIASHISTVRKQRFEIAGMPAQEWSTSATEKNGVISYDFLAEIPGKATGFDAPSIELSMRVGRQGKDSFLPASLTEGEAIALWDAVIKTLRLRPGAF